MKKAKVGDIVAIEFIDHSAIGEDSFLADPLECVIFGRVAVAGTDHYDIDCWALRDPAKPRDADTVEAFRILKATISSVEVWE